MTHIPSLPAWTGQQPPIFVHDLYRTCLKETVETVAIKVNSLSVIVLSTPFFEKSDQLHVEVMRLTLNELRGSLQSIPIAMARALSLPSVTEDLAYRFVLDLTGQVKGILSYYAPFQFCEQVDVNLRVSVGVLSVCCDQLHASILNKLTSRVQSFLHPVSQPTVAGGNPPQAVALQGAKRKGDFSLEASKVPRIDVLQRSASGKDLVEIFKIAYPLRSHLVYTGTNMGFRCDVVKYDDRPEEKNPIGIEFVWGAMETKMDANYKQLFYLPEQNEEVLIDASVSGPPVYTKLKVNKVALGKNCKQLQVQGLDSLSKECSYKIDSLIDLFPFKPLHESGKCVLQSHPGEADKFYIRLTG